MARIRTIKPAFFKNDALAELGPYAMLLFEGLWCLADKEGRLEDRPKRIKAEILPYFDVDVDELLGLLQHAGFIARYTSQCIACIYIYTFKEHQRITGKEADSPSTLPEYCPVVSPVEQIPETEKHRGNTGETPEKHLGSDGETLGMTGRERKGKESITFPKGKGAQALSGEDDEGQSEGKPRKEPNASKFFRLLPESHQTPEVREAVGKYFAMRREKKYGTWADSTIDSQVQEWSAHPPEIVVAAFSESARNQWQGVFVPKTKPAAPRGDPPQKGDSLVDEAMRIYEKRQEAARGNYAAG